MAAIRSAFETLFLRGAGSATSVLLTMVAARVLTEEDAGKFLYIINMTMILAVNFRWGIDDVVVRSISVTQSLDEARILAPELITLAHHRVASWLLSATIVGTILWGLTAFRILPSSIIGDLSLSSLLGSFLIAATIAMSAVGGRSLQGIGRTNAATFILNIVIPAATLAVLIAVALVGLRPNSTQLFFAYGMVAISVYIAVVWGNTLTRPSSVMLRKSDRTAEKRAANRLGGVVLAQQSLNWFTLLTVPMLYGPAVYVAFAVDFKVASLVSLVMLATNFTLARKIARLYSSGDRVKLLSTFTKMITVVFVSSAFVATVIYLYRGLVYELSSVENNTGAVLLLLLLGQVFFALAAVSAMVLTMSHDELFLLRAQGICTCIGTAVFFLMSVTSPVELACIAFPVTYGTLAPILIIRVARIIKREEV